MHPILLPMYAASARRQPFLRSQGGALPPLPGTMLIMFDALDQVGKRSPAWKLGCDIPAVKSGEGIL